MTDYCDLFKVTDWFWGMLESSDHNLQRLCDQLETLTEEQLVDYQFQYEYTKGYVNPFMSDDHSAYVTSGCSEDTADDFADWVVSQGRIYFEQVRQNPTEVQQHLDIFHVCESRRQPTKLKWDTEIECEEYRGWQTPGFIARGIYFRKFDLDDEFKMEAKIEARWDAVIKEFHQFADQTKNPPDD